MKHTTASLVAAVVALGVLSPAWAVNLKDKVTVEIESAQFHADMVPGTYMCAALNQVFNTPGKAKLDPSFEDLVERKVKNIVEPIRIYRTAKKIGLRI